jgi:pyrroline-5-carboxylate reductase
MPRMQLQIPARIAFVGGGNMARALIGGLLRQGIPSDRLAAGESDAAAGARLQSEFGICVTADNSEAVRGADLVVLAVKPQQAASALGPLRPVLADCQPLLLSIAAGLRIEDLAAACPTDLSIVRAMPNRAALVGAGVTGLYAPAGVTLAQRQLAELVGNAAGRAVWVRAEAELDVVTALSGSGPAYFFLLAEEMARAAEALGLSHDTAQRLAAGTLHGAGMLANESQGLAEQRLAVTSKGGTTEAALRVFEQRDFSGLVAAALQAAATRSVELAGALTTAAESKGS